MENAVKDIENLVASLPKEQLNEFRTWYEKFESEIWDEQIEKDVLDGKFDSIAAKAIADHNDYERLIRSQRI